MILFKPEINVSIDKIIRDENGRYVLSEAFLDDVKFIFVNIYAPNDQTQQIHSGLGICLTLCSIIMPMKH